jgi:hypothetical protein
VEIAVAELGGGFEPVLEVEDKGEDCNEGGDRKDEIGEAVAGHGVSLDGAEGLVGLGGEGDVDGVSGAHGAGGEDDGHDAGVWALAEEDLLEETGAGFGDLDAGGAVAGDLEDGFTDLQACAGGEGVEVEVAGGEVFAEFSGHEVVAVEEFGVQEVDLGEIGVGGLASLEVAVLGGWAGVGVAFCAVGRKKVDLRLGYLVKAVDGGEAGGDDSGGGHELSGRMISMLSRVAGRMKKL